MSASVVKQIADLERLSHPDLQGRWRQLVGGEPPRYTREFLIKRLAHRLQELAHGGLSQATREQMDQLLDDAGYNELGALRAGARPQQRRDRPAVGTRLIREYEASATR